MSFLRSHTYDVATLVSIGLRLPFKRTRAGSLSISSIDRMLLSVIAFGTALHFILISCPFLHILML